MKTKLLLFLTVLTSLLLLSCTSGQEVLLPTNQSTEPELLEESPTPNETQQPIPSQQEGLCTPDWICLGSSRKVYQDKDCYFIEEEDCRFGCVNGTCKASNAAGAANTEQAAEEPALETAIEDGPTLAMGKVDVVEIRGIHYNISLYNLEVGRAMIDVNGVRGDWMGVGDNHTFPGGIRITIKEIMFQSYTGGIRRVIYKAE